MQYSDLIANIYAAFEWGTKSMRSEKRSNPLRFISIKTTNERGRQRGQRVCDGFIRELIQIVL
jgi:hypothetical protein